MIQNLVSRRRFALGASSIAAGLSIADTARSAAAPASAAELGITNASAAIHQEVPFKASPAKLYQALTDETEFDKVVVLSGAMKSMKLGTAPTRISTEPGGAFALFGGYINGRQIVLTPGTRIIQAWHSQSWKPDIYSIVKFDLMEHAGGTMLVFDHTGFPSEDSASLANGWHEHYWEPLAKLLA